MLAKSARESLCRIAKNFTVKTGRLYCLGNQKRKTATATHRLVIELEEEKEQILRTVHEDGHLGKSNMSVG